MYTVAHSTDPPAMVILFAGRDSTEAEYEGVVQAWERLYRDANGRPAVGVVVVPIDHAQPNAYWRRRFAEVHGKETGPMQVGVVTESALIRGVITAVNWLMHARPNYRASAFDSVDAAAKKLGSVEGVGPDTLVSLFKAAQASMRERIRTSGAPGVARA